MIKVIFFDLDGTLYASEIIREKFAEAAYTTLAALKNISVEDARALIETRRDELQKKQGFPAPYTLTLVSYGLPIEMWHEQNVAFFDPRDYLKKDPMLKTVLHKLKTTYRLAILTNNNDTQSERILEALGIDGLFDKIFTYNTFKVLKPDPEFFRQAARVLGVEPKECLVVGDRYHVDLDPAQQLGMRIYEVNGPEDIYHLPDSLEKSYKKKRT
jgi:putative hydrolase of the HAD superfamily